MRERCTLGIVGESISSNRRGSPHPEGLEGSSHPEVPRRSSTMLKHGQALLPMHKGGRRI